LKLLTAGSKDDLKSRQEAMVIAERSSMQALLTHRLERMDMTAAKRVALIGRTEANKMLHSENGAAPARSATADTTFELHYSIADLAKQWRLSRETIRVLIKDEPGVVRIRLGRRKSMTRYSVPESVARRVHTKLFNPTG
jgi:hypothetical protein